MQSIDRRISAGHLGRLVGAWRATGPTPSYTALADRLTRLVLDGSLPLGTRLPSERELAPALGVSRTTVTAAYDRLHERGFVARRRGSGTWTTLPRDERAGRRVAQAGIPLPDEAAPPDRSDPDAELDLAVAAPAAPSGALHAAVQAAVAALPRYLPGPGYSAGGLGELREAVAARLTGRGLPTTPEQLHVTQGAQHALALLLRTLAGPGDRVLVEDPTYPNALVAVRGAGLRPVPAPLGDGGWDLELLESAVRQTAPRLVYLQPDFHNPTGQVLPSAARARVAALAGRTRTVLVVDETLSELGLDGPAPEPLAGHAPEDEHLVTIGSVSKAFWGGVRVGWVRAAPALLDRLRSAQQSLDLGASVLDQLTAAHLVDDADTVLAGRRALLREQRDALVTALRRELPDWSVPRPPGGLSLWVGLGAGEHGSGSALAAAARAHRVLLVPPARFGAEGGHDGRLRIPFTSGAELADQIAARLAGVVAGLTPGAGEADERRMVV